MVTMLPLKSLLNYNAHPEECTLRKPSEVGRFSLDCNRQFHHNRHQMACYAPPDANRSSQIHLDLSDGFNTSRHIQRNEEIKERLNSMLTWLLHNRDKFLTSRMKRSGLTDHEKRSNVIADFPDFLLWRGHLTKFMCTPFENRDGWIMACQRHEDTIYISEVESQEAAESRRNRTPRETLMTYWGMRFEGYMTGSFPKPGEKATPHKDQKNYVTNTNKAFCAVFRSRLNGRHSLMYGAEVDCCKPVKVLTPPDCYVELKTSRKFSTYRQEENFYRFKALKWWAQSYLVGIPQITCGFRDDHGIVQSIHDFNTFDLPEKAVRLKAWNPTDCLVFLDNLLQSIKDIFRSQRLCVDDVLILQWNPGDTGVSYKITKSHEERFLPDWYLTTVDE